jgi:hypothetical protein
VSVLNSIGRNRVQCHWHYCAMCPSFHFRFSFSHSTRSSFTWNLRAYRQVGSFHALFQVQLKSTLPWEYRHFCRGLSSLLNGEQQPGGSSDLEVNKSEYKQKNTSRQQLTGRWWPDWPRLVLESASLLTYSQSWLCCSLQQNWARRMRMQTFRI